MSAVRWSDVRDKHVGAIGEQDVEQGKTRLLSQVRAHRLAEMRERRGLHGDGQWSLLGQPRLLVLHV